MQLLIIGKGSTPDLIRRTNHLQMLGSHCVPERNHATRYTISICQDQPRCAGLRIFIAWNIFPCAPGKGKFCSRISTGRQVLLCRKQRKHSGGCGFLFGCVYLSKEMIQPAFGKKRALEFGHSLITAERSNRIAQAFRPG